MTPLLFTIAVHLIELFFARTSSHSEFRSS